MVHIAWESLDAPAGAVRLHVRRVVEPSAPPILLLHGLGVSGAVWQGFARRLLPEWAAVVPDLRGHGESDAPPDGYLPPEYARDLVALLEGLEIGPLPVVGHSLGALVALALADSRPDLITAVVLVDPPIDAERTNSDVPTVFRLRRAPAGELERYLYDTNPAGGHLLAKTLARLFRQAADEAFEAMLAAPPGHPEAWEQVARLRRPLLVVRGDPRHGGAVGEAAAEAFVARAPAARLVSIDGASHAVYASHPAETAKAIKAFLADPPRAESR